MTEAHKPRILFKSPCEHHGYTTVQGVTPCADPKPGKVMTLGGLVECTACAKWHCRYCAFVGVKIGGVVTPDYKSHRGS